ncbi:MAG: beta galactosidase jelly roll domain-containing protein [Cyclobacteriaceae bacterium]|nr:beta galactosidase jelly roll domain-containing protein [Cyclobacteriaceae bacterium HetDA_MAG_MS6]
MAQLKIAEIFTDNMVLQRNQPIKVWGWSGQNEKITLKFQGKKYTTKVRSGVWTIDLPAMQVGGPYNMTIEGASEEIVLSNILVGDIWVCSGQSNMAWTIKQLGESAIPNPQESDDHIRHFKVSLSWSQSPEDHLDSSSWAVNNSENRSQFSAVGYYFAKSLREEVKVPIGLLNTSWGGSRIQPWISKEALQPFLKEDIEAMLLRREQELKEAQQKMEKMIATLSAKAKSKGMHQLDFDDSGWETMKVPGLWEQSGYPGMDGLALFRRVFTLSDEEQENGITLNLGKVDDSDWVYINGQKVGGMLNSWNVTRSYKVSPDVLKKGENIIVIRVEDTGGGGGIYGKPDEVHLKSIKGKTSLAGDWKFKIEKVTKISNTNLAPNQTATVIFNKMIHPILDFPIKGVIWYQGESNANFEEAFEYRKMFPAMIEDWRSRWGLGDFPFLWVQLANFMEVDKQPTDSDWALLRESQTTTLDIPNTAQAVIIDIGEANDIHPKNKRDVGYRLSLGARKLAYGETLVYSGPVFKSMAKDGESILIDFEHQGSGLMVNDRYNYVKGFAICGADKKFKWAKARIEGDKVRVWSEEVPSPQHVRYAWSNNPGDANLYNKEGLPACPFRTDR